MKIASKNLAKALFSVSLLTVASVASAVPTVFTPPNDAGMVYSANANDGWYSGRGIGFSVNSNQTINSVGVYEDLTNVLLSYGVYEINALTGTFSKTATLRNGSATVTTAGLQFIDFNFADLTLSTGKNYLLEFSFAANSNQNFFYNNANQAWSQGNFSNLEGTASNHFSNFVVAEFRVGSASDVPEPGSIFLLGAALIGLAAARRVRNA